MPPLRRTVPKTLPRTIALATALAAAGALAVGTAPGALAADDAGSVTVTGQDALGYVNPFIGTQNEGNTYPGASVPFGMVQLSPDTGHNTGYDYTQGVVRGFSLAHMSGVGCGLDGFVPITPTTSVPTTTDYSNGGYSRSFDRDASGNKVEQASPGYYSASLGSGTGNHIKAELTATTRTGEQRYTFSSTTGADAFVLVNAGQALSSVSSSSVSVDPATRTVRTVTTVHGFCQDTKPFTVYSTTTFDQPFTGYGTWTGNTRTSGSTAASSTQRTGAWLQFATDAGAATVQAATSLSYVDAAGADANLAAEVGTPTSGTFDTVRAQAQATWAAQLGKVEVTQGVTNAPTAAARTEQLRTFYSALYRTFLAPNVGSDTDGRYTGWDGAVHTAVEGGKPFTYYQNFSLWDTYRSQEQVLGLLEPAKASDMAYSVVLEGEQGGWAPRWSYGPVETNIMTGDPVTPYLVSAWSEGLLTGSRAAEAYAVLKQDADGVPPASSPANGRMGNPTYIADGFVPQDPAGAHKAGDYDIDHGGSATLEYALADGALSTMAAGLGHTADAQRYAVRSQSYRSIWDSATGIFRARTPDGQWVPAGTAAADSGFHEGTAWQYQWLVQQDVPGLIGLMGGDAATNARLDDFFGYDTLLSDPAGTVANVWASNPYNYYDFHTYNPNNEPDLTSPYVYLWTGQPWKTADVVRSALTLFTDGPTGVTGNDDLGEMSSWAVASSIGIFPIMPGSDVWGLTTPAFDAVRLALDPATHAGHDSVTLTAPGVGAGSRYVTRVQVGGKASDRAYLTGPELTSAGTVAYSVGAEHSDWATAAASRPGAMVTAAPAARLTASASPAAVVVKAGEHTASKLAVVATGPATLRGIVQVDAPAGIHVDLDKHWSTAASGGASQVDLPATVSVDAGTAPGSYTAHLTVKGNVGIDARVADITVVVPQDSWLAAVPADQGGFDNKAIGDRDRPGSAAFDAANEYFLRDTMASSGMAPGVSYAAPTDASLHYVLHDAGAGSANDAFDNIVGHGQTTDVSVGLAGATKVAFVGALNNGPVPAQTVTLTYADGSTQQLSVTLTDWCSGSAAAGSGDVQAGKAGQRWAGGVQGIGCGLWATPSYALTPGVALRSITWPDNAKFHVFAIASDAKATAVTATSAARVTGTATPGATLTAVDPTWAVDGVTAGYQWSVDGQNVAGATSATYDVPATDAGHVVAVTVTGSKSGYVPGSATSAGVKVVPVG